MKLEIQVQAVDAKGSDGFSLAVFLGLGTCQYSAVPFLHLDTDTVCKNRVLVFLGLFSNEVDQ